MISRAIRCITAPIALALVIAALGGCGGGSVGGNGTEPSTLPTQAQSDNAFPTNGTTAGPDVITTPGQAPKTQTGKAGAGSAATCIGC